MHGGVSKRLLSDSKQTECASPADVSDVAVGGEVPLYVIPLLDFDAVGLQCHSQPDMSQNARMEVVRETPNTVDQTDRLALERRQRLLDGLLLNVAAAVFQVADCYRHYCERLAHVVVEVAGNAGAFDFLRSDQPAGQILDLPVTRAQGFLDLL